MRIQSQIEDLLKGGLALTHLEVRNESSGHRVPANSETHFRVVVVSPAFEGQSRLQRHRTVNALLADPLQNGVHALAIEALTPSQFEQSGAQGQSPACRGGTGL